MKCLDDRMAYVSDCMAEEGKQRGSEDRDRMSGPQMVNVCVV